MMRMFIDVINMSYDIRMAIRTAMFGLDCRMAAMMVIEAGREIKNRKFYH